MKRADIGDIGVLRRLDERLFGERLRAYRDRLSAELAGPWESFLDVGCGEQSYVAAEVAAHIPYTVGVDKHQQAIELARSTGPYSRYECLDVLEIERFFGPKSFDVVMALDVIEHLPKEQGWELLDAMEATARNRVVVFTPNGYLPQHEFDGNPYQAHLSGWRAGEFQQRGYRVAGVNGLKPLRGERWIPRIKPVWLGNRLSAATEPLVTDRPNLAFQLLAVLDLD